MRASKTLVTSVTNKIYLINSTQSNAFVLAAKHDQIVDGQLFNHIFITNSLLKDLLNHSNSLSKDRGERFLKALLGILAHEMAHPVEGVQDEKSSMGWNSYLQSSEVAADLDAIFLLRNVGLPADCLYVALKMLMKDKNSNFLEAAFSSHPHKLLRLSLQRLSLTLANRFLGIKKQVSLKVDDGIFEEFRHLAALPPKDFLNLKLPVLPLGTLAEIRAAIDNQAAGSKEIFNHLILILGERLSQHNEELAPDFQTWLIQLILRVISVDTPRVNYVQYPDRSLESSKTKEQLSFENMHPRPADILLAQAPALNHEKFKREFRIQFIKRFGADLLMIDLKPSPGPVPGVRTILRSEYWYEVFRREWVDAMGRLLVYKAPTIETADKKPRYALADASTARIAIQNLFCRLPLVERLQAIEHFLQHIDSKPNELISYLLAQTGLETMNPFLVYQDSSFSNDRENNAEILSLARTEPAKLGRLVDFHWNNRRIFMFADVLNALQLKRDFQPKYRGTFVNWPLLYKIKKLDPDYGRLAEDFADFARSREFAERVEVWLPQIEQDKSLEHLFSYPQYPNHLAWWNSAVAKALITLFAEPYVDRATQEQIMARSATALVDNKKPIYLLKNLMNRCEKLLVDPVATRVPASRPTGR